LKKIRVKILGKIVILIGTILVVAMGTNTFINIIQFEKNYRYALQTKVIAIGENLENMLQNTLSLGFPLENLPGLNEKCLEIVENYSEISDCYITNTNMEVIYHNNPSFVGKILSGKQKALQDASVRVISSEGEKFYEICVPILHQKSEPLGTIRLDVPAQYIYSKTKRMALNSVLLLIASFIVVFLVALYFARGITRPLKSLTDGAKAISSGNFDYRLKVESNDEVGELSESFGRMAWNLKQREKELRESRDYLHHLLERANDLIYTVDTRGCFTYLNPRIKDYGYSIDELLGKHFLTILTKKHGGKRFGKSVQEKVRQSYEVEARTKDGVVRNCIISTSPLLGHDGKVTGLLGIMRDITEKKKAEEEIRKKNEELENFVYVVSHDLKAPLISVQGFSSVLLKDYHEKLGEEGQRYLERIKANTHRMEVLITDLLTLSRIGRVVHPFKDVPCLEIVKRVCSTLKPRLEKNGIEVSIADNLPTIHCDEDRIYQVFENLLVNAIKFMGNSDSPEIEIGYEDKNGFHQFYVRDTGIGIDPKYHRKIFEIFHRLKEIEDEEGTGIGLVIVERIINNHGGKVWVDSEKGKGATFYFTLSKTASPTP